VTGRAKGFFFILLIAGAFAAGALGLSRLAVPLSSPEREQKTQALRAGTVSPDGKLVKARARITLSPAGGLPMIPRLRAGR
jgi:hypothetical protein